MSNDTAPAADSYEIVDPAQLEMLTSMRRHDIGDRLGMSEPMSVKELARSIGAQPSALYHHIEAMLRVGLVVEAGSRVVNRKREVLYSTPAKQMRLAQALADPANADVMNRMIAAMSRQVARDFAAGAELPSKVVEGDARNYRFFRLLGRPTPEQTARINACIGEVDRYPLRIRRQRRAVAGGRLGDDAAVGAGEGLGGGGPGRLGKSQSRRTPHMKTSQ